MAETDSANDDEQVQSAATIPREDTGAFGSANRDATSIDGVRPSPPPPLVSWQMPGPSSVRATDWEGAPIRLWRPVDLAVVSFLIGFPAGLGLAARNAWRLGRRRRAWVQLAGGSVGLLAVVLMPGSGTGIAAVLNITLAIYVYFQTKSDVEASQRAGHQVERGGVASGFATALGAWALALAVAIVVVILLTLAGGPTEQLGNAAIASSSPAPASATLGASATSTTPGAAASASSPTEFASGRPNGDPDLAAMLPASVSGQALAYESYRGRDLFTGLFGLTDADVTSIGTALATVDLSVDDVSLAVDGRSGPDDPPYFVNALRIKGLPTDQWQSKLGLDPGALEVDHLTAGTFTSATVGGKAVLRGTLDMVDQTTHVRGIPYVYRTGDVQFVVITDDPAWAADALRQLP